MKNEKQLLRGKAISATETFEFSIERFVSGGFVLGIRYFGDCHHNVKGAGVWPTIDKAKEIAEQTAHRLLQGAAVTWESPS
jgi:hypothetical protein